MHLYEREPDTTAIRAHGSLRPSEVRALCDALDAARAENVRLRDMGGYLAASIVTEATNRAEQAEAAMHDLAEELMRAQDVIARVREYVDDPGNWSALNGRRALLLRLLDGEA